MKTLAALVLCMFFVSTLVEAQQCKVYFTVIYSDSHLPGGGMATMSPNQKKWWEKKGMKKYPGVCYDPSKATYSVVWWKETVGDNYVAKNVVDPRFNVTVHSTSDIGSIYIKRVGAPATDKPLFFVNGDDKGTVDALEKAMKFLTGVEKGDTLLR
jgi:hypothetical protein